MGVQELDQDEARHLASRMPSSSHGHRSGQEVLEDFQEHLLRPLSIRLGKVSVMIISLPFPLAAQVILAAFELQTQFFDLRLGLGNATSSGVTFQHERRVLPTYSGSRDFSRCPADSCPRWKASARRSVAVAYWLRHDRARR